MECLHCGKKISALRKLQDEEFCSAAHRKAYKKKQEDLDVDFLRQSKPRRVKPEMPRPQPQPAAPVEPQPILVLSNFRPVTVNQFRVHHALRRNAPWMQISPQAILPASGRLPAPSPCARAFARVAIRPEATAPQIRGVPVTSVAFGRNEPVLQAAAAHPVWIEPVKQAPVERPAANFTSIRPVWARASEHPMEGAVAFDFPASRYSEGVTSLSTQSRLSWRQPARWPSARARDWILRRKASHTPGNPAARR